MIREFVQSVDDREWQTSLFSLLQSQSYNQCEVDLFELMCKVLDQNLFSQVDWARNTVFFKDLKVSPNIFFTKNLFILIQKMFAFHNQTVQEHYLQIKTIKKITQRMNAKKNHVLAQTKNAYR